jgi:Na+-transporting methylmalonyl-CoA/oxaloacetate decarboxylase gamma subunit
MYLVAIGWIYVVLMMSVAEALSSQGTVLGAVITFVFYGVLPLVVVMYIMGTPSRRRARLAAEAAEAQAASAAAAASGPPPSSSPSPDGRSHAAADTVAAERKEP